MNETVPSKGNRGADSCRANEKRPTGPRGRMKGHVSDQSRGGKGENKAWGQENGRILPLERLFATAIPSSRGFSGLPAFHDAKESVGTGRKRMTPCGDDMYGGKGEYFRSRGNETFLTGLRRHCLRHAAGTKWSVALPGEDS